MLTSDGVVNGVPRAGPLTVVRRLFPLRGSPPLSLLLFFSISFHSLILAPFTSVDYANTTSGGAAPYKSNSRDTSGVFLDSISLKEGGGWRVCLR